MHDNLNSKLKEANESIYTIQNIQLQAINTKLSQAATQDQLSIVKKEMDDQVKNEKYSLIINIYLFNLFRV